FPLFCFRKLPALVLKSESKKHNISHTFLYNQVIYYLPSLKKGMFLKMDRVRLVKLVFSFFWLSLCLVWNVKRMRKEYRAAHSHMTSEIFWRDVYNLENPNKHSY